MATFAAPQCLVVVRISSSVPTIMRQRGLIQARAGDYYRKSFYPASSNHNDAAILRGEIVIVPKEESGTSLGHHNMPQGRSMVNDLMVPANLPPNNPSKEIEWLHNNWRIVGVAREDVLVDANFPQLSPSSVVSLSGYTTIPNTGKVAILPGDYIRGKFPKSNAVQQRINHKGAFSRHRLVMETSPLRGGSDTENLAEIQKHLGLKSNIEADALFVATFLHQFATGMLKKATSSLESLSALILQHIQQIKTLSESVGGTLLDKICEHIEGEAFRNIVVVAGGNDADVQAIRERLLNFLDQVVPNIDHTQEALKLRLANEVRLYVKIRLDVDRAVAAGRIGAPRGGAVGLSQIPELIYYQALNDISTELVGEIVPPQLFREVSDQLQADRFNPNYIQTIVDANIYSHSRTTIQAEVDGDFRAMYMRYLSNPVYSLDIWNIQDAYENFDRTWKAVNAYTYMTQELLGDMKTIQPEIFNESLETEDPHAISTNAKTLHKSVDHFYRAMAGGSSEWIDNVMGPMIEKRMDVAVAICSTMGSNGIGIAQTGAKPGGHFDILLTPSWMPGLTRP